MIFLIQHFNSSIVIRTHITYICTFPCFTWLLEDFDFPQFALLRSYIQYKIFCWRGRSSLWRSSWTPMIVILPLQFFLFLFYLFYLRYVRDYLLLFRFIFTPIMIHWWPFWIWIFCFILLDLGHLIYL